jgi:hypothetical protein
MLMERRRPAAVGADTHADAVAYGCAVRRENCGEHAARPTAAGRRRSKNA